MEARSGANAYWYINSGVLSNIKVWNTATENKNVQVFTIVDII